MSALDSQKHKALVEREFEILDRMPLFVQKFVNENGSPAQYWLMSGKDPMFVEGALFCWVRDRLAAQQLSSRSVVSKQI